MHKREIEIAVVSDVHLGTYGCHADELNQYLSSIKPRTLILNGDIIDMWQFSKSYFPESHIKVIRTILKFIEDGVKVYYITGNHDEKLRSFTNLYLGKLTVTDKLIMTIDGKQTWFFHGDIFDVSMKHAKWLAKLGGKGYDLLIVLNKTINNILFRLGYGRISLSKKIKDSVKKAVSFISDFESTVIELAACQNYDTVVCGHIHSPIIKTVVEGGRDINYMNSGDWVENLSSLEYNNNTWKVYKFHEQTTLSSALAMPQRNKIKLTRKDLELSLQELTIL
ncbi:MAG: UDP-2,3-diacylglucosamine diphosphatase [Bacteroidetes bacterium]|nr:UDP-2,3-diacylglucosamine diphosphatase [Bacteroidota bacterium]